MTERQEQLLTFLIESYIRSAEPVGSKFLVEAGTFDVSGATVRNELRELEEMGYLTHPHTSAGRIPTEKGYQFYVEELMNESRLSSNEVNRISEITGNDADMRLKQFAKASAEMVNAAVVISFDASRVYYTGMTSLFSQAEFQDIAETLRMSELFDHIEDRIISITDIMDESPRVFVGSQHPLGSATSIAGKRFGESGMILYLAPMRMQYSKALACLNQLSSIL